MATFPILDIKNYWRNLSDSIATVGGALMGKSMQISGSDGSNSRIIKTNNSGEVLTQLTGSTLKGATVATVTTAGTRVQLPTLACSKVTIIAKRANTGYIYVGMNTVSSTVYGAELAAKDSMDFDVSNLNEIWIDASVSGEGISYIAI